jgi:hypothetical protein
MINGFDLKVKVFFGLVSDILVEFLDWLNFNNGLRLGVF